MSKFDEYRNETVGVLPWFLDSFTCGGTRLPAVTDRSAAAVWTGETRLVDAGLLRVVAGMAADPGLAGAAGRVMTRFGDPCEPVGMVDPSGVASPVAGVDVGFDRMMWEWASTITDGADSSTLTGFRERWERAGWAEISEGGQVVVAERRLATAGLAVLAARDTVERAGAADVLAQFWQDGRFWDRCDMAGDVVRCGGTTIHDLAWAMLACRALAGDDLVWGQRLGDSLDVVRCAIVEGCWCPGVWSVVDQARQVAMSPLEAYARGDRSPFPWVSAADQALLVAVLHDLPQAADIVSVASGTLRMLTDVRGGVFEGQGSWFSTPTDPTVPLDRLVMAPEHVPAGFSVGNTRYVPMGTKHAYTQMCAIWAGLFFGPATPPARIVARRPCRVAMVEFHPDRPLRDTTGFAPPFDTAAYLGWLEATRTAAGFGVTPYPAPLGWRSDTSAQVFSMVHVLSDYAVLSHPGPDPGWVGSCLRGCQNPDGGFSERAGIPSEVFTTYCAVLAACVGGCDPAAWGDVAGFLHQCQHGDGGYGNFPGYVSDAWHSNLAVTSLAALGVAPTDVAGLVGFLDACHNPDGGYGQRPGRPSDVFATFRVVGTFACVGIPLTDRDATIDYVRGLCGEDGGFRYKAGAPVSFVGTYHGVAGLYMMGEQVPDLVATRHYITSRQAGDGGFGRVPGGVSETTDEGFISTQACAMLDGVLDPVWAVMLT